MKRIILLLIMVIFSTQLSISQTQSNSEEYTLSNALKLNGPLFWLDTYHAAPPNSEERADCIEMLENVYHLNLTKKRTPNIIDVVLEKQLRTTLLRDSYYFTKYKNNTIKTLSSVNYSVHILQTDGKIAKMIVRTIQQFENSLSIETDNELKEQYEVGIRNLKLQLVTAREHNI